MVETALARGLAVTLFNRGKTNPELFPTVEKLRGDRDGNLGALAGRRWDAVIDTSGYVPRATPSGIWIWAEPDSGSGVRLSLPGLGRCM